MHLTSVTLKNSKPRYLRKIFISQGFQDIVVQLYSHKNKNFDFVSSLRGATGLITQNVDPHKIIWIKCSFLKFSQLRDVVHRIRAPYLFHFET